jgi:hypothetical protein
MKVAILGKTAEIPDDPFHSDPESLPEFLNVKKLVEEEFEFLFDRKIEIANWDYIISRAFAHKIY